MPEVLKPQDKTEKTASNLVTSENRAEFMDARLRPQTPAPAEQNKEEPKAAGNEETTAAEEGKAEAKAGEKKKGNGLSERFSELTEARKNAEAKAKAEAERAAKAEAEAAELRAKLAPPKPADEKPAPQRTQYQSDDEYIQALTDHKVEAALNARDKKAAEERAAREQAERATTWAQRMAEAKKANPEFEAKINASEAQVSAEMAEEIRASPAGTKMLEYFADHPEEAARIGKLTVGAMLKEMGKLEAKLEAPADKQTTVTTEEKAAPAAPKVEISKAPAPIDPIKGGNGAAVDTHVNSKGEFTGTFADFKALRAAGKIK